MNYTIAQTLSRQNFKRHFGIHRATFEQIVKALRVGWRATPKPGAKPKLSIEDRVLVALEYWRECRTYFHIGNSWGVSESTVSRVHPFKSEQITASQIRTLNGTQFKL